MHQFACTIGVFILAATSAAGQVGTDAAPNPLFEVVSVKASPPSGGGSGPVPNSPVTFSAHDTALKLLIQQAYADVQYSLPDFQVSGGPAWAGVDRFDIDAKTASPATPEQKAQMLRALLAERFHLVLHRETKLVPAYALLAAKGGVKARQLKEGEASSAPKPGVFAMPMSMKRLAAIITIYLEKPFPSAGQRPPVPPEPLPVVDQTGLAGDYDIVLDLSRNADWFVVLEEQLGLKLEKRRVPMEVFVIDHAERPAAN